MRPSVSFSYESVLHNYFVRHNSLIFISVRFFIAAFKYDGHESFLDSLRNKAVSHTFIHNFCCRSARADTSGFPCFRGIQLGTIWLDSRLISYMRVDTTILPSLLPVRCCTSTFASNPSVVNGMHMSIAMLMVCLNVHNAIMLHYA